MKLSQSLVSSLARTQRSLTAPGMEDQEIQIPSIIIDAIPFPFVLENLSTVPVTGGFSTSIICSDLNGLAGGAIARDFLFIDRGVWKIDWTAISSVGTSDQAQQTGLTMTLVGPPTQMVTLASFISGGGSCNSSGSFIVSLAGDGAFFSLIKGATATAVGQIQVSVSAQKLL